MGHRSSRLFDYNDAKEQIPQMVTQFEQGFDLWVRNDFKRAKHRKDGDIFKYPLSLPKFASAFVRPIFPGMPDPIVDCLFYGLSGGSATLTLKDLVAGVAVIMCGTQQQQVELLSRCYDPKSTGYITLKTLKRITADVDRSGRNNAASKAFLQAVVQKSASGYNGYEDISVKEFQELALEDGHANNAPIFKWLMQFRATLKSAARRSGYRYGTLIQKESTLAALHKETQFTQKQIEALSTAVRYMRHQHSHTGFLDGRALLSFLGPPRGFVPPLVLQRFMRYHDSTNTGALSLRELVAGLAKLEFDVADRVDVSRKFVFTLFADRAADDSHAADGHAGDTRSVPHLLSRQGFRQLLIAFGVGAQDNTPSAQDNPANITEPVVQRQVSLEDIEISDIDDNAVASMVEAAFSSERTATTASAPDNMKTGVEAHDATTPTTSASSGGVGADLDVLDLSAFEAWEDAHGQSLPLLRSVWTLVFVELGVRPTTPALERRVVQDICRGPNGTFDVQDPGEVGRIWYLIPSDWWRSWKKFTVCTRRFLSVFSLLSLSLRSCFV